MAMGWYERVVFRRAMDAVLGQPEVHAERVEALAHARGAILEVGIGTGLNLPAYPDRVTAIKALTLEAALDPRAAARAAERGIAVSLVSGDAERMPFDDETFDTVACTFLLCSVGDPSAVVREVRRILRPEGRLLFMEHVAYVAPGKRAIQRVLDPVSRVVSCGCSLVRESASTIADAGLQIEELVDLHLPAMTWPHRRVIRGVATRGSAPLATR